MNYKAGTCFLLIVAFFTSPLFGQGFLSQTIPKAEAAEDFDHLRSALEQGHSGLYWYRDSAEVSHLFDSLRSTITTDLANRQFHSLLTAAMQTFSCGHAAVLYPEHYPHLVDSINTFIPLKVKLTQGKVFVLQDFSDQPIPTGSEILSINELPIQVIVDELSSKVPTDKGIDSKQIRSLDFFFPFFMTLYYGITDEFRVQYRATPSSTIMQKTLPALPAGDHIIKSSREIYQSSMPIEFTLDKEQNTAYLTIRTFEPRHYKAAEVIFADTIDHIFQEVAAHKIDNLIIDLRYNIGGAMKYGEILLSYVIKKPTNYYRDARIKQLVADGTYSFAKMPRMKERFEKMFTLTPNGNDYVLSYEDTIMPSESNFDGDLYILTNGLSFSSTACFIAHCVNQNRGVLIGEEPGGAYSGLSTSPNAGLTLPNSDFRLFFRTTLINLAVQASEAGIQVDHPIATTIDQVIDKSDPQMQFALKLVSSQ